MHYAMVYEYSADYLERRGAFRAEHLKLAWQANASGELFLAGAFADPADGALFIFHCDSPDVPERFAANDPYVRHGLVTRKSIRAWTTTVGRDASTPTR